MFLPKEAIILPNGGYSPASFLGLETQSVSGSRMVFDLIKLDLAAVVSLPPLIRHHRLAAELCAGWPGSQPGILKGSVWAACGSTQKGVPEGEAWPLGSRVQAQFLL